MKVEIKCEVKVHEAEIHFSKDHSYINFKAHIYPMNSTDLQCKNPITMTMYLKPNIANEIREELERCALKTFTKDKGEDDE